MDPTSHSILIIGTYRHNEIDETHFLPTAFEFIRKNSTPYQDIRLAPLTRQAISDMIKDTVGISTITDDIDMEALCECVYAKTEGNAFFVTHVFVPLV